MRQRRAVWGLAVLALLAAACTGGVGGSIEGQGCDPACAGATCNSRCEADVIYHCGADGVWALERDCGAEGRVCETQLVNGGPEAELSCGVVQTGSGGASGGDGGGRASGGAGAISNGGSTGGPRVSPGTVDISFSLEAQGAYCVQTDGCSGGPAISISDASGRALVLGAGWCPTLCSDCTPQPCPGMACQPMGVPVGDASLSWDGAVFQSGTCGAGASCVAPRYAPPGRYTARFCATRGTLETSPQSGMSDCIQTGEPECVTVEFDFPADESASATLPDQGGGVAPGVPPVDPACAGVDSSGFFSDCSACTGGNCDSVSAGGSVRSACGCASSADCPCGLACGSYEIAPGVSMGGVCVR